MIISIIIIIIIMIIIIISARLQRDARFRRELQDVRVINIDMCLLRYALISIHIYIYIYD